MKNSIVAFICGLLFAAGLGISGMTKPERVQGFLDIFWKMGPKPGFSPWAGR